MTDFNNDAQELAMRATVQAQEAANCQPERDPFDPPTLAERLPDPLDPFAPMQTATLLREALANSDAALARAKTRIKDLDVLRVTLQDDLSAERRETERLRTQLETPDFMRMLQGLVHAEVNSLAERYIESTDFAQHIENSIKDSAEDYLEHGSVDIEGQIESLIEKAIEDSLQNVRIRFN